MEYSTGTNPIIKVDFPDPDVIMVDNTFYMIGTTMHFLPGGEILRSYDLINWEHASYVFDTLDGTPAQKLEGKENIYGKGMWAGSLRYHDGIFYVAFSSNDTHKTYLYRSSSIEGPWAKSTLEGFYYDLSLFFDGDRRFVVHGNTDVYLTELNPDMTVPLEGGLNRLLISDKGNPILGYEGSHIYKIDNRYHLFCIHSLRDRWKRVEAAFSSDSLEGEFQGGDVLNAELDDRPDGIAQGGIVKDPDGNWNAVLFRDNGAVGRIPVVVPLTFTNGRPVFGNVSSEITLKDFREGYKYRPITGSDDFKGSSGDREEYGCFGLKSIWQFNHEPDMSLVSRNTEQGYLSLRTDKLCDNICEAGNTLTQRMTFPRSAASVTVDASGLNEGDIAGLAALQGKYAFIGITLKDGQYRAVMYSKDDLKEELPLDGPVVRFTAEATFEGGRDEVRFFAAVNGSDQMLGDVHKLEFRLDHFTGARYALFVFSTKKTGGEARFSDFVYR